MNFVTIILNLIIFWSLNQNHQNNLKVAVYDLKNDQGQVIVLLYNKAGSIPDKTFKKYYKKQIVKINNGKAEASFNALPSGKYAVNIIHDENANGKLDKGFMLPKEGFGLSNFKKVNLFHKPNFEKASFILKQDTTVQIKTIYF